MNLLFYRYNIGMQIVILSIRLNIQLVLYHLHIGLECYAEDTLEDIYGHANRQIDTMQCQIIGINIMDSGYCV